VKSNNVLKHVKFCKEVHFSSIVVTPVHPYLNPPEGFVSPGMLLTNCREALQGRELTPTLLDKHSPRGNFVLGFPHKAHQVQHN